jgi:hypothetical protein
MSMAMAAGAAAGAGLLLLLLLLLLLVRRRRKGRKEPSSVKFPSAIASVRKRSSAKVGPDGRKAVVVHNPVYRDDEDMLPPSAAGYVDSRPNRYVGGGCGGGGIVFASLIVCSCSADEHAIVDATPAKLDPKMTTWVE